MDHRYRRDTLSLGRGAAVLVLSSQLRHQCYLPLSETPSAFVPVVLRSVARLLSPPANRQLALPDTPSPETTEKKSWRRRGEQAEDT